jgi:hypothetical protein
MAKPAETIETADEPAYVPPQALPEDPPLVTREDLPVLFAISRFLQSRVHLHARMDAMDEEIEALHAP